MNRDQWMRLVRLALEAGDEELAHGVALEMAAAEKRDATRKGTGPKQGKLTPATITELRRAYWSVPRPQRPSYSALGRRYALADSTVSRIINRQRYADLEYVPGEPNVDAAPLDLNAPDALEAARRARAADALEGGGDIALGGRIT